MKIKHGQSKTRIYRIYQSMKQRCYNINSDNYKNYGGRGIIICKAWRDNFEIFYNWAIITGYKNDLTIDRINNDKNYTPSNCRWVNRKQQCNNFRRNRNITAFGETKTMKQWSEDIRCQTTYRGLKERLNRGLDAEAAIGIKCFNKRILAFGESKTAKEWSNDPRCVISDHRLLTRIRRGWNHEKAITTPIGVYHGK